MPSGLTYIEHVFGGGWAPDYGASAHVEVDKSGRCVIPWLVTASNMEFEADGSPHKVGGVVGLFPVSLEGGEAVRGLYDFWRQGIASSPLQSRVLHVGTKVKMDDADAVFADVFVGLSRDSIPNYSAFEGQLIIAQTGNDMPMYTDGVTYTTFSSPTPNFSYTEPHKLRQWAAGVDAAPSHLFYSAYEDPTNWTGADTGDIAISPGDGDRITAIASHRNELFVFKGPYKGSIHRISGSAPLGDDAFARHDFIPSGLGAVGQNSIFRFGNDLGFIWSDGSVHSLNTTEKYGDFLETSLSRPLNRWLRQNIHEPALPRAWAITFGSRGVVRFTLPTGSAPYGNKILSMDYRFDPPRWSIHAEEGAVPFRAGVCIALVYDPSRGMQEMMMTGTDTGFVFVFDNNRRALHGAVAYDGRVTTPFLSYVRAPQMSTIYFGGVRVEPYGAHPLKFSWVRDGKAEQASDILPWSGDVLGVATGGATNFTLGTSSLGGDQSITRVMDLPEGGEFQQIQYKVEATAVNSDLHLKSIIAAIKPGSHSTEAVS